MASIKTKFAVGTFLALGLALTVIAIIWLGMSHYLDKGQRYVAYFDESVQGLDKDSPVKYRGVPVGRVEKVGVAPDAKLVEVVIRFESKRKPAEHLEGIFAQIKSIGITGIMFIELDRKKEAEPAVAPKLTFTPEFPVIDTRPSDISKILSGLEGIIYQFKTLDMKAISDKLKLTLDNINQTFVDAQIKVVSSDLRKALKRIDSLLQDKGLEQITQTVTEVAGSLDALLADTGKTINRIDRIIIHNEAGIKATIDGFKITLAEFNRAVGKLDRILATNEKSFNEAVNHFSLAMQSADKFLAGLDRVLADNEGKIDDTFEQLNDSAKNADQVMQEGADLIKNIDERIADLHRHLLVTTQNLRIASENLNSLIDMVSDPPSLLFFGEPLPPRRVETDRSD
jgi:phospholipid/cholesterol/gamma-HCH transport system substrate-binding protein